MGKKIAVFGIYPSRADAEYAVDTLRQESFRNTDVSVLFPANEASKSIGHEKSTKAPEGAAAGAAAFADMTGIQALVRLPLNIRRVDEAAALDTAVFISGYEGSKARQVLISEADLPRVLEALGDAHLAASDSET